MKKVSIIAFAFACAAALSLVGCAGSPAATSTAASADAAASAAETAASSAEATTSGAESAASSVEAAASAAEDAAASADEAVAEEPAAEEPVQDAQEPEAMQPQGTIDPAQPSDNEVHDYVEMLVWQNGLGELVDYRQEVDSAGNWYLVVDSRGADGNVYTSTIGTGGNVISNGYYEAQAEDAYTQQLEEYTWEHGLGEYVDSQPVVGENGVAYQEIVTMGSDGLYHYTYVDTAGNTYDGGAGTTYDPNYKYN